MLSLYSEDTPGSTKMETWYFFIRSAIVSHSPRNWITMTRKAGFLISRITMQHLQKRPRRRRWPGLRFVVLRFPILIQKLQQTISQKFDISNVSADPDVCLPILDITFLNCVSSYTPWNTEIFCTTS
jgi:hypothetical protein